MNKILRNLFSNALKFSDKKTKVWVTAGIYQADNLFNNQKYMRFTVKNSGPGIPDDKLPHIFDRLFQVDGSTTRKNEGLGIGLALVKEYVKMHHGNIDVTSGPDGTEFVISLPLGKMHLPDNEIIERPQSGDAYEPLQQSGISDDKQKEITDKFDSKKSSILITEDNLDLRQYLKMNLEKQYAVHEAANGKQALDALRQNRIDLVLLDIMMPVADGMQVLAAAREEKEWSSIPFLVLTAKSEIKDMMKGLRLGAVDYISKPFHLNEVLYKIRSHISIKQEQKEQEIRRLKNKLSHFLQDENNGDYQTLVFEKKCIEYELTPREKDILQLILEGLDNSEIGEKLHISKHTVKNHISSVFDKCGVEKRMELVKVFK